MLKELVKLANHLDSKGLVKEADDLDRIITKISQQDPYIDARTPGDPELEADTETVLQQGDGVFEVGNLLWYRKYRDKTHPMRGVPARVTGVLDNTPVVGEYQVETIDNDGNAIAEIANAADLNQMREEYKLEASRQVESAPSPGPGAFSGLFGEINKRVALAKRINDRDPELVKNIGKYPNVLDLDHPDFKGVFPTRKDAWKFAHVFGPPKGNITDHFRHGGTIFLVKWKEAQQEPDIA